MHTLKNVGTVKIVNLSLVSRATRNFTRKIGCVQQELNDILLAKQIHDYQNVAERGSKNLKDCEFFHKLRLGVALCIQIC